ncbi:MAG: hypothetical protein ACU83O_02105, partial [Gammaproteobacteria bacterium]
FSHPKASFFLLRGQKKETKEKAARLPLESCAPRFYRGLPKGISYPFVNSRHPCRAPDGLFPAKAPVLGAANGSKLFTYTCVFLLTDFLTLIVILVN